MRFALTLDRKIKHDHDRAALYLLVRGEERRPVLVKLEAMREDIHQIKPVLFKQVQVYLHGVEPLTFECFDPEGI